MKCQVTLGDHLNLAYHKSPKISAWPKKINSWDKCFIGGGEYDAWASANEHCFANSLCVNARHFVNRQITLGYFLTPAYQRSLKISAWPKKINSWDKSFIGGGEYDAEASGHARITKGKRWIRGKEECEPINWHVLKPIMALGGFKDIKNIMNPTGPIKDLRIFNDFNDELGVEVKYGFK